MSTPQGDSAGRDALSGPAILNFATGMIASGGVLAILFPLDALKTHAQTNHSAFASLGWQGAGWPPRSELLRMASRVYRGFTPAIIEHSLNRGAMFGFATIIKDATPSTWSEPARDATSGGGAAVVKTMVLHPLDTMKTRWQLGQPRWEVMGLYNGVVPAMLRSSPGMAIWMSLRNFLSREVPEGLMSDTSRHFIIGCASSTVTDVCTFPFDTLKKTMQYAPTRHAPRTGHRGTRASTLLACLRRAETSKGRSPGWLATASELLAKGGFRRFFYGYPVRFSIVAAKGGIDNSVYVAVKRMLQPIVCPDSRDRSVPV